MKKQKAASSIHQLQKKINETNNSDKINLNQLFQSALPLMKMWKDAEKEQQEADIEFEKYVFKRLNINSRILIICIFVVIIFILFISLYLFQNNKETIAMDLIKLAITVGGAIFGGYGWAKAKHSDE